VLGDQVAQTAVQASSFAGLILTLGSALGIGAGGLLALWLRRRMGDNANPTVVIASYVTPVMLLIVLIFGLAGRVDQDQSSRIGVLSLYWHFVDGVWVVVFTVVYILGR